LESALLAGAGVTASPRALDGPMGFFDVCAPNHGAVDWISDRLGDPFEVVDPGLSPKLYPSCSETHAAADAILEMRAEGLKAADVKRIRCGITPAARGNLPYGIPATPLEAKFSQEYCLAAPLVRGKLGLAEFEADAVADPAVRELMARIEVAVHPDLSGADTVVFSSPAIVEVDTVDGRTLRKLVREMRGHPKNPLGPAEIEAKFVECGERVLKPKAVRRAMELVMGLEKAKSVRPLLGALTPAVAARKAGRRAAPRRRPRRG
jgi:2-methylcitrate dehydratase PrpD